MHANVLVLNSYYSPLGVVDWTDAIARVYSNKADIVAEYEDKVVRSADRAWSVPSVIRIRKKSREPKEKRAIKFNRKNLWKRDKGLCCYCGCRVSMEEYTYDHVIPRSKGGKTSWTNIVVACLKCNHRKADRTPAEAKMPLLKQPEQPKSLPGVFSGDLVWDKTMPVSWRDWLASKEYWDSELEEELT